MNGYIRPEDREKYREFCTRLIPHFVRKPVDEIWHYTNAEGLIGILKTGHIWATQVDCLNDSMEQKYFSSLIHSALKSEKAKNTDPNVAVMLETADKILEDADFAIDGHFVACFTEVEDDLNQWRGYGGGECGYALGFSFEALFKIVQPRFRTILIPMQYEDKKHNFTVEAVIRAAKEFYLEGLQRGVSDPAKWAQEFLEAYAFELDIFSTIIKHPSFIDEKEWRLATLLNEGEHNQLEFRQKRTLLARHLPLNLTVEANGKRQLPITRIYVGPGPSQRVSQVSVGDLAIKYGYDLKQIVIEKSRVPYRVL